jgi:hypothetical protein
LQRSHNFHFIDNSDHLKDLIICILWTLVMSFSGAQAIIVTLLLPTSFSNGMFHLLSMGSTSLLMSQESLPHKHASTLQLRPRRKLEELLSPPHCTREACDGSLAGIANTVQFQSSPGQGKTPHSLVVS